VVNVGAAAAGFPQDETITTAARNTNILLFMFTRLYDWKSRNHEVSFIG
jgi:hypothetical protein